MSELNCKGSFMLGSACGTCPRCVRNIDEIARSTPLGARINKLEAALKEAVEALKDVCKPESDGFGGIIADEFTSKEVLSARKTLARIKEVVE